MSALLLERGHRGPYSRREMIKDGKGGTPEKGDGKTRYQKRINSRIANSVQEYNKIDMNKLFKKNILTFDTNIQGETDNYVVTIQFYGFLDKLKKYIDPDSDEITSTMIKRALSDAYNNTNDIKVHCTCPDYKYRFTYLNVMMRADSKGNKALQSLGIHQYAPRFENTNKDDKMGSGCKHCQLVLANTAHLIKIASVINNYIKYAKQNMQKGYQTIIYPAIFGKEWTGQLGLDRFIPGVDTNDSKQNRLKTSKKLIKQVNNSDSDRGAKGRFTQGNQQGVRFAKSSKGGNTIPGQMSLFDDNDV